jgi:hypothetical protein
MLHVTDPQGRSSVIQSMGCFNINANIILVKPILTIGKLLPVRLQMESLSYRKPSSPNGERGAMQMP